MKPFSDQFPRSDNPGPGQQKRPNGTESYRAQLKIIRSVNTQHLITHMGELFIASFNAKSLLLQQRLR